MGRVFDADRPKGFGQMRLCSVARVNGTLRNATSMRNIPQGGGGDAGNGFQYSLPARWRSRAHA